MRDFWPGGSGSFLLRRAGPPMALLGLLASCTSIEVRSDVDAEVYLLGPSGMESLGPIEPGSPRVLSRFFGGRSLTVGCLTADARFAYRRVPAGQSVHFIDADYRPARDLLRVALDRKVRKGMNEQEIRFAWGPPAASGSDDPDGRTKILQYERGFVLHTLVLRDDALESWTKFYLNRPYDHYWW